MKKICLVLTLILLCGLFVASCDNSTGGGGSQNPADSPGPGADLNNGSDDDADDTGEPATERIMPDVPDDRDFGGHEFIVLTNGTAYNSYWYSKDIYAEEENGDAINDAVYARNRVIEAKYNISIKDAPSGSQYNEARRSITSGDNRFDMHTVPLQGAAAQLAQEGLLMDLKEVPYIDLDKPWWDRRAYEQLSIGNKLMFTVSDLLIMDKDSILAYLFNKDMVKEYALEDPYQLVRDGKWTIDKMWDMARSVTRDLNGDGVMDDSDQYGFIGQSHTMQGNIIGAGQALITKDENDLPMINVMHPLLIEAYAKWIEIFNDRNNTFVASDWERNHSDIWEYMLNVQAEGRGLFQFTHMDRITLLRGYDFNFGILPNTKLHESQERYHNAVNGYCSTSISIPITADPERTGIILEAWTAESYYTLRSAYYEVSLKTKFLRDDESEEMLDLIFDSRVYDLGNFYNWGEVFGVLHGMVDARNTDYVSAYERIMPRIERDMQRAIEMFLENT